MHEEKLLNADQKVIWEKWADILKTDPSPENYAKAYDEVNAFLRDKGDPARGRSADGTIYGETGDENDWQKSIIISLAGQPGKRVLEVGCGDGRLVLAISRRGARAKGIDISKVAIETARQIGARQKLDVEFEAADAIELAEADQSFDFVLSSDMVEHLNPEQVVRHLQEVRRVLRPGGAYIVSLPAWEPPEKVDPLHLGNYHPHEFAGLLRKAGFFPELAPKKLYRKTGDLVSILGPAKTAKAKIFRGFTKLPLIGGSVGCKLIERWCGRLNFFYAEKI